MPIYEYECTACKTRFERSQRFSDPPVTECPECGGRVRRVLFPAGIVFKGSGWYVTDSRKSTTATTNAASDAGSNGKAAAEASGADSGAKSDAPAAKSGDSGAPAGSSGTSSGAPSGTPAAGGSGTTSKASKAS